MKTTWICGASGMLGTELRLMMEDRGLPFLATDREVDIRSASAVQDFLQEHPGLSGGWILNCAAYTAVDKAEDDAETCRLLNAVAPGVLAAAAVQNHMGMIHISTDYVFDGTAPKGPSGESLPWTEDMPTGPLGVYGETKRDGEESVRWMCPDHYIVRTAWLYGAHGPNFVHTMLRLMKEKPELTVVADQYGCPTWTRTLAEAILVLTDKESKAPFGTYHLCCRGNTTWHGFAREIGTLARQEGLLDHVPPVIPVTSRENPVRARRPAWSVMDTAKIQREASFVPPHWNTALADYLKYKKTSEAST